MLTLVTDRAGFLIRDGVEGFVAKAGDATALAEKLVLLSSDRELQERMGAAARARAEEFSWERFGESLLQVYRDIVKRSGSSGRLIEP